MTPSTNKRECCEKEGGVCGNCDCRHSPSQDLECKQSDCPCHKPSVEKPPHMSFFPSKEVLEAELKKVDVSKITFEPSTNKRECCRECRGIRLCLNPYCTCHTEPSVEKVIKEYGDTVREMDSKMGVLVDALKGESAPDTNKRMGGWEEEFDRMIPPLLRTDSVGEVVEAVDLPRHKLKSFIKEKIDLAHSEGAQEERERQHQTYQIKEWKDMGTTSDETVTAEWVGHCPGCCGACTDTTHIHDSSDLRDRITKNK